MALRGRHAFSRELWQREAPGDLTAPRREIKSLLTPVSFKAHFATPVILQIPLLSSDLAGFQALVDERTRLDFFFSLSLP